MRQFRQKCPINIEGMFLLNWIFSIIIKTNKFKFNLTILYYPIAERATWEGWEARKGGGRKLWWQRERKEWKGKWVRKRWQVNERLTWCAMPSRFFLKLDFYQWICYTVTNPFSGNRLKKRRQFCKHMSEISSLTHQANQIWSIWLWFQNWYFPRIVARLHCPRWPGATRGTLQERRPPRRTRESPRLPTSRLPMQGWRKSKGWPGLIAVIVIADCMIMILQRRGDHETETTEEGRGRSSWREWGQ